LGHAPLLLQLHGALAFQRLPGGGVPAVILGALALLLDPALLLLAGNAIAVIGMIARLGTITRLGDPVGDQRLLAAPFLAGAGVAFAVCGGLALLRKTLFAVLPFKALLLGVAARLSSTLLLGVAAGRSRALLRRGALRCQALFRSLLLALGLLSGKLLAFGDLAVLTLAVLLLPGLLLPVMRDALLVGALLVGALVRGRGAALLGGFALASLRGSRVGLGCGGMILALRRLLVLARLCLLFLLLVVLLIALVARILARIGRGTETGGQQGAEHGGQQGAVGNGVHGNPRVQPRGAGRKRLLARGALHVKST
jgi:hypothetical protein